jgi:hypothetical protein
LKTVLEVEKVSKQLLISENDLSDSNKFNINITKTSLYSGCQYFTAEEAEVDEPLIINKDNITTDSSNSLENRDIDSDEFFDADRNEDDLKNHIIDK